MEREPGPDGAQGRVLGMMLGELTVDLRRRYSVPETVKGLMVLSVDPGWNAAGKVKIGDVIVEIAFEPVETIGQARALAALAEKAGGRPLLLYINRGGEMTFRSVRPRR
jgi:serine protease Do